jgi:hypothetical protein
MQEQDKEDEQKATVAPVGRGQVHPEVDHGQQDDRAQAGGSADWTQGLKNALVVQVSHHASEGTEESCEDEAPHVGAASQRLRPFTAVLLPPFPSAGEAFTLEFLPFEKVPHAFEMRPPAGDPPKASFSPRGNQPSVLEYEPRAPIATMES